MSTIIYTKSGIIQHIQSDEMSIPADERNRDYRKVMIQDGLTPFPRVEIVEPELSPSRDLSAELDIIQAVLDDMILGGA
jgi:hypothetical protein